MLASFEQLLAEHDSLDVQAAAILRMCEGKVHPGMVSAALDRLACAVDDHLQHEDGIVYPVVANMRDAGRDEEIAIMTEQLAALRADWCAYLATWTRERIGEMPTRFCEETRQIMTRLQDRVRTETECLYPIALGQGVVRLREMPK